MSLSPEISEFFVSSEDQEISWPIRLRVFAGILIASLNSFYNATMFVEAAVEGEDTQALFILEVLDNGLIYASTGTLLSVIGLFMLGMAAYNRLRADAA